jgi:predicted kinase
VTIHLLHGPVGSGKTTFARLLERDRRAVRFSPDEWMCSLYGENPPAERFQDYLERILAVIWQIVARLVELDVDVVLDFGFWTRQSRDEARERARKLGAAVKLYQLTCSEPEMRRRVLARTAAMPPGALWINEAAIDLFRLRLEPLGPDEDHIVVNSEGVIAAGGEHAG